jgi:hypothetical protein
MILVGNQQKLYPEQTTGINELKFGSWAYANNAHYTVYAVPDTTYYASSSGKADCKFGQKHIKFYDFTIIPDVDNDTI